MGAKSAIRALSLLVVGWRSQPSAMGLAVGSLVPGCDTTPKRDFHDLPDVGRSLSRQQRTRREVVWDGYKAKRYARRLRSGQPGFSGEAEGSRKPMMICWRYGEVSMGGCKGTHGLGIAAGEERVGLIDRVYLCGVTGKLDDEIRFRVCMECVEDGCELEERLDERVRVPRCYLSCTELLLCRLPPVVCDLPGRLGDERREGEPVVILVFLEISECDEKKSVEFRGVLVLNDAGPDLVCMSRDG